MDLTTLTAELLLNINHLLEAVSCKAKFATRLILKARGPRTKIKQSDFISIFWLICYQKLLTKPVIPAVKQVPPFIAPNFCWAINKRGFWDCICVDTHLPRFEVLAYVLPHFDALTNVIRVSSASIFQTLAVDEVCYDRLRKAVHDLSKVYRGLPFSFCLYKVFIF